MEKENIELVLGAVEQRRRVIEVTEYFGSQALFAEAIGKSKSFINHLANGRCQMSGSSAIAMEYATNGKFPAYYMRPDLFDEHYISRNYPIFRFNLRLDHSHVYQ